MKRIAPLLVLALPFTALPLACGSLGPDSSGPPGESTVWSDSLLVTTGPAGTYSLLGQCLQRTPTIDASGIPACVVVEARHTGGTCACDATARYPVSADHQGAITALLQDPAAADLAPDCFCEVSFLTGASANACATDTDEAPQLDGQPVDGICYIDDTITPPIGNPQILAPCPSTSKRLLRFVGAGAPAPTPSPEHVMIYMTCEADAVGPTSE